LRAAYRERRDALASALRASLPDGCDFAVPGGGYFIWVTLARHVDTEQLLQRADPLRVSFIPGARLTADGSGQSALRLCFALMKPPQLVEGARRLGALIHSADA
jgi:2-aminoadipate transaminase